MALIRIGTWMQPIIITQFMAFFNLRIVFVTHRSTGRKHLTYPEVFIRTVQCSTCLDATEHSDFLWCLWGEKLQEAVDTCLVEVFGNVALHTGRLRIEDIEEGTKLKKQWKKFRVGKCNTDLIVPLCDVLFPVLKYYLRNLTWAVEKGALSYESSGIQVFVFAFQDRAALAVPGHGSVRVCLLRGAAGPQAAPGQGGHPCQDTAHTLC